MNLKVLPLSEVKLKLSELVKVVEGHDEELTITRNGRTVATLVSTDAYVGWRETVAVTNAREFMKEFHAGIRSLRLTKKRYTAQELFED